MSDPLDTSGRISGWEIYPFYSLFLRLYHLSFLLFFGFLDGLVICVSFAGMPTPQKELTDEFNVLEAGLWNSISLNKGTHFLP